MNTLRVQKQVRLGLLQVLEICGSGMYFRLFRSLVTVAVVTVAIAFMMYMLGGSAIRRGVQSSVTEEAQAYHLLEQWLGWLAEPMGRPAMLRLAAQSKPGDFRFAALRAWGGLSEEEAGSLRELAEKLNHYVAYFEALPPGKRFLLAAESGGESLLDAVPDEAAFDRFAHRVRQQGEVHLADSLDELRLLFERYRTQQPLWDRVVQGRQDALRRLEAAYPGRTAASLLAEPPSDLRATLAANGFAPLSLDMARVMQEASREAAIGRWTSLLRDRGFAAALSQRTRVPVTDLTLATLAPVYLARGGAEFVQSTIERHAIEVDLPSREDSEKLLREHMRRQRILNIETALGGSADGQSAEARRTLWLVGVAFVVCVVGIANAMLMSVMERFREIATMKCLGATDGFVMTLFVLESCVQGIVGGLAGALLGLLVALPQATLQFGGIVWQTLNAGELVNVSWAAIITGAALAAVASVYPAYVAARLAPMEAMRLE